MTRRSRGLALGWFATEVLVPCLATRVMLLLVGWLALALLKHSGDSSLAGGLPTWIYLLAPWDAEWYASIARDGYSFRPRQQSNVAFPPLVPVLMKAGQFLTGRSDDALLLTAGIVAANLALLVALIALVALLRLDFDRPMAARTACYLMAFPTSLYFSLAYSESVFLALTLGAFLAARRQRWWIAGLLGGVAGLARTQGVLLVLPLALEYLAQRKYDPRAMRWNVLSLGLIPLGVLLFFAYLGWQVGDPLASLKAQAGWKRQPMLPWETFDKFFGYPVTAHGLDHSALDLGATLLFVVLIPFCWRVVRPSYTLYATVLLIYFLSTGRLTSMTRFVLLIFPAFVVLARMGQQAWFDRSYLALAGGLSGLFMAMVALRYWLA